MRTSGLILDHYDDKDGSVLKAVFPTAAEVPDIIKQAQDLSAADLRDLPDDCFALVLKDNDTTIRKFASVDAGHVLLNAIYLVKNAHKLPDEAVKVAAQNILTSAEWYKLGSDATLEKMALLGAIAGLAGKAGAGLAAAAGKKVMSNPAGALTAASSAMDIGGAVKNPVSSIPGA